MSALERHDDDDGRRANVISLDEWRAARRPPEPPGPARLAPVVGRHLRVVSVAAEAPAFRLDRFLERARIVLAEEQPAQALRSS